MDSTPLLDSKVLIHPSANNKNKSDPVSSKAFIAYYMLSRPLVKFTNPMEQCGF
jgi:hypothetical protein